MRCAAPGLPELPRSVRRLCVPDSVLHPAAMPCQPAQTPRTITWVRAPDHLHRAFPHLRIHDPCHGQPDGRWLKPVSRALYTCWQGSRCGHPGMFRRRDRILHPVVSERHRRRRHERSSRCRCFRCAMPEAPSVAGHALRELLLRWTSDPPNFDELLENTVDGTLAFILHSLGDHDPAVIRRALQREEPVSTYSTVFSALVKYQEQATEIYSDRNPSFPASGLLLAMQSLSQLVNERDRKATVYHVTQQLFADILRSPLLDQQFRLLNALCLWIAVRWPDFHDSTLLHRLVCGAASLLAQRDLSRRAQSILEWAFKQYPQVEQGHRRLPDILLRVSSIVDDFTRQPASQELGASLRTWVDEQVSELYDVAELTEHVVRALSAWPWSHDRHDASTLATLSDILGDSSIVSNRFRLVRRLQALSSQAVDPDAHAQFADIDFWRLKESILPRDQLQIQDVEAFATLLETHEGRISSFPREQSRFHGKRRDGTSKAIDWIVTELLLMLEASDISTVHIAYRTLRLVMSVDPTHALELSPDHHREIELIKTYRCVPLVRMPRSLEELHDHESALVGVESDFPHWVRLVATLLSDILSVHEPFYAQLTLILEADSAFTAKVLPVLVHAVLQSDPASREPLSIFFRNVLQSAAASLDCTRCIVDIVLYLRQFGQNLGKRDLSHDKWLAIDYMLLAEKAIQCGAYTTALLFIELAHEYSPQIQESAEEELLYEIYSHIDEPDGFYAVKSRDTSRLLVKRFHHEHQWDKAFHFHGASFTSGVPDETAASGLVNSFHAFGFDRLAMDALYKYSPSSELTPLTYRLGWRTESWDLPDSTAPGGGGSLYRALRAVFAGRNKDAIKTTIQASFLEEIERLRVLGSENLTGIRDAAQNLMCIQQVSRYAMTDIADRSSLWVSFATLGSGFEFPDFENLMATRLALVHADKRREETRNGASPILRSLLDAEKRCLIRLSQAAREAQQSQIALNSIETARRDDSVPEPIEVSVEYAHVLHMQNEQQLAVKLLTDLNLAESQLDDADKAVNFACLGTWLSDARLGDPTNIAEYFDSAALYVKQSPDPESRVKHAFVCEKYATFAAQQYKTIRSSSDGIRWQVYVDRKREQLKHLAKQGQLNLVPSTERLYQIDLAHLNKHADALQMFLAQAIEMYSRALEISDDFDGDAPIRLCSLWFQNFNSTSDAFQQVIQSALKRVPSRKLVFLAHQLSARIDKSSDPTQKTLQSTVLKMCIEHPFHSFYQVWSLLPATEQAGSLSENRRQSGRSAAATEFTSRSEASSELFARLKQDKQCRKRVLDMALLASASQQWALHKLDKNHVSGKYRPIPASIKLQSIANLNVPVLTNPPAVDPSLKYTSFVAVGKFDTQYTTAGGVNLPKIYICLGSDGATYKQLFKGSGTQDDLRQDAVMEQVFTLVNTVLAGNRETKRRSLLVRGYRIVPLGAMAGVLEFVSDTIPYLSLVKNLYRDYTPSGSWTLAKATAEVFRWKTEKIGAQARVPLMEQLLRNFRPVLRHYFTEQHKNPLAWFEMRLAYTRSVATTSIVGHILGLGDRHGSNILVSKTGEVVHIDLGIAFDQGTFLPVPELVPFRLTANMVDGMGVSGTDGVFQRCCEETLRVLRDRSEVIMTVLEVFKHDPLHSWTMSDYKKNKAQQPPDEGTLKSTVALQGLGIDIDMSSGNAAESADRALAGVTRKLDKSLAVGSMVNSLIAQATDPARLASIYYGWGPQN
ncbi:unnamed protein product [Mycena citricolor]|uniref:Serine/threonine-protein kinase TEL1 n=1 Tax=Mycena citricolor TaxID=2018698 RepID=A0AAD2HXJ3_9AGAR|nr:unnamed protein product [Mycena citricolor]